MTISTELRKAGPYLGDGAQTRFPFSFKVFKEADIKVVVADTTTGHERELVLGRDYKVHLQTNQNTVPGGNVVLAAPLAHNDKLVILSHVPYLQPTEITNQGAFYPSVINNGLDRSTIQIQQLAEIQARSLSYPATITGFNPQLPPPEPDKALGYNDDLSGFKNIDIAGMKEANAHALATSSKAAADAQAAIQKANDAEGIAKGIEAKADQAIRQSQSAIGKVDTAVDKTNQAIDAVDELKSEFKHLVAKDHATTADRLRMPRCINGVLFDGSSDINVTPSGAIQFFCTPKAPIGWLKANGAEVSRKTYANLFYAIGTTFGEGDGWSTFNLPDLRGEFLRGLDEGRGVDANRTLGDAQGGQILDHTHGLEGWTGKSESLVAKSAHLNSGFGAAAITSGDGGTMYSDRPGQGLNPSYRMIGTMGVLDKTGAGSENRPRNVALLACIKI